jgi:hypothetical protein
MKETSCLFFLKYVLWPRRSGPWSRYVLGVAAGFSFNTLISETGLHYGMGPENDRNGFSMKKNVFGGYAGASLDCYFTSALSLQFKIDGMILPVMKVPERTLNYEIETRVEGKQVMEQVTRTIPAHEINPSGVVCSFGLGIHL